MTEKSKPRRRESFGPPPGNMFTGDPDKRDESGDTVVVAHGPYMEHLPVGSMTIGEIRRRFCDRLDIDPLSRAVLDGDEADENTVVQVGQVLTFIRKAGEKGRLGKPANDTKECERS